MENLAAWLAFGVLVVGLLALDLLVFHRKLRAPSLLESAGWVAFWVALAAAFNVLIWRWRGGTAGVDFLTGYLVEWSLSMDNVFVFVVIFRHFRVDPRYQYRVLFWGVLGAVVLRLLFVLAGAGLLRHFEWVLWLFGLFLVYTGLRLALHQETRVDPQHNWLLRLARRFLPLAPDDHGGRFVVRTEGGLAMTRLLLVLLVIESTDLLFAVDSVPAIFGVTRDPFIVFTSNIFAILGLRALYFLLAGMVDLFRFLKYGLSAVLVFIGAKMIAEYWLPHTAGPLVPAWAALGVVAALLALSIAASLVIRPKKT